MIKTFCDRCGAECTNEDSEIVFGKELCEKCQEELSFWLSNTPTWKTKYDTLRRFCLDMFGREQTIRQSEMPSRAAIAKKLYDDQELADIKDKIWDEVNCLSENWC